MQTPSIPTTNMWLALVLITSPLAAQEYLREVQSIQHISAIADARDFAHGDLDGDGDLDLVVGTRFQDRVLRNDGHALFTDITSGAIPAVSESTVAVQLVDIDGDGDLDLFRALESAPPQLLANDGTGTFTDATTRLPVVANATASDILAGDLDNDGDSDLIVRPRSGTDLLLWFNDGQGQFTDLTTSKTPPPQQHWGYVAAADVDGDGDLDLVRGFIAPRPLELWLNDGTGSFQVAAPAWMPTVVQATRALLFADHDADGDSDLIVVGRAPQPRFSVYENDQSQRFVDLPNPAVLPNGNLLSVAALDVDGDQDLDFAFGVSFDENLLMINQGNVWKQAPGKPFGSKREMSITVSAADFDGDGRAEVLFGNHHGDPAELWLNADKAGFFAGRQLTIEPSRPGATTALALADIDGDGDLDLLTNNSDIFAIPTDLAQLYHNDGRGRYRLMANVFDTAFSGRPESFEFADFDADGDLDLLVACKSGPALLYRQEQSGRFTRAPASHLPAGAGQSTDIAVGDLDGDGDVDAVISQTGGYHNLLLLNDGTGRFAGYALPTNLSVYKRKSSTVELGDLDGDGDLDAVFGYEELNWIYTNDGKAKFTPQVLSPNRSSTEAVALVDVDRDGDLDIFTANSPWRNEGQDRLFMNDGHGVFTDATAQRLPTVQDYAFDVVVTDIDLDGDPDLVVANPYGPDNRLLLNDGLGFFTPTQGSGYALDWVGSFELGDVDRDGDPDLVATKGVIANLTHQLDAPVLGRTGQPFVLRCNRSPWRAAPGAFVIPHISFGSIQPLRLSQLGWFHLDPTQMIPLQVYSLDSLGFADVRFPLPHDTNLIGLKFYSQALFGGSPTGPFRLSNAVESEIVY